MKKIMYFFSSLTKLYLIIQSVFFLAAIIFACLGIPYEGLIAIIGSEIGVIFILSLWTGFIFHGDIYMRAGAMGATRKWFYRNMIIYKIFESFLLLIYVVLQYMVCMCINQAITPHAGNIFYFDRLDLPGVTAFIGIVIGIILRFTIIDVIFTVLFLKFGKKFYWIFWALWMIVCLGGTSIRTIKNLISLDDGIYKKIMSNVVCIVTGNGIVGFVGGIVLFIVVIVGFWQIFKKQEVR